jgi:hypothetical protein
MTALEAVGLMVFYGACFYATWWFMKILYSIKSPGARRESMRNLFSREPRIYRSPGWVLGRFAKTCFSKKTFIQVLEPTLSDMQLEYFEALAAGRRVKAFMVLVRGYWSFWSAAASQLPISLLRRVYEVWKATKIGD